VIELVSLDRLKPVSSRQAGSGIRAQLRNGQAVEAKVVAMLDGTTARLEIHGRTIDVSTSRSLKPGTTATIALDSDGRSLKLAALLDTPGARPASAGGSNDAPRLGDALGGVARTIGEALLTGEAFSSGSAQGSGRIGPDPEQSAALPSEPGSHAQLQAGVRTLYDLPMPQQAYDPTAAQAAASSGAGFIIPFQLPQMTHPVMITVKEEDESEADRVKRQPTRKRWTVKVSVDAGTVGLVHVNIGLCASALSVRLSAHQAGAVSHLHGWLPELNAVLEQSGFAVEELSVQGTNVP
jgi:hypothetical protein